MEISSDKIPGKPTETVNPDCASVSVLFHSRHGIQRRGIGGGGLFIPILTIVAGLDLKIASGFSAFMVTGGSIANVNYNLRAKSDRFGHQRNSSYLFVHGVLLIHNVCFPILIVGHGADRHRARIFIHLFCRVAESNKGVRESIPNRVLDRYRDSSERHFDDYL
ncbi:hypothetical protein V6N13_015398 [Hibiscus sabdariffa]